MTQPGPRAPMPWKTSAMSQPAPSTTRCWRGWRTSRRRSAVRKGSSSAAPDTTTGMGLPAGLVEVGDECLEIKRLAGGANRLQHRGEIFVAIVQKLDFVAGDQYRICQGQGRADELRVAHGKPVLEMIFERVPSDKKKAEQQ